MIAAEILIAPTTTEPSAPVATTQTAPGEGADFAQVLAAEVGEPVAAETPATAEAGQVIAPTDTAAPVDAELAETAVIPSSAAIIATLTAVKGQPLAAVTSVAAAVTPAATTPASPAHVAANPEEAATQTPGVVLPGAQPAVTNGETPDTPATVEVAAPTADPTAPVTAELAAAIEQTASPSAGDAMPADVAIQTETATDDTTSETKDAAPAKDKDQTTEAPTPETAQVTAQPVTADLPLPLQTVSTEPSAPVNPALAGATVADAQTDAPDVAAKDGEKGIGTETVASGKGKHRAQGGMMGKLAGGLMREASTESDMQARATKLGGKSAADGADKAEPGAKVQARDEDSHLDAFHDQLAEQTVQPKDNVPEQTLQDLRSLTSVQGAGQGVTATADRAMTAPPTDQTPVDVMQPGWEAKMGDRILSRLTEHGQEIEMDLNPENLGSVRIKLELTDGTAQVRIITDTAQAAQVFQQAEGKLAEALNRAGVSLSSHDATSRDATAGGQQRGAGNGAGNGSGNGSGGRHDGALANLRRDQADLAAFTAGRRAAGIVNIVA